VQKNPKKSLMKLKKGTPSRWNKSRGNTLIPILLVVVLAPLLTFGTYKFLIQPKMDKILEGGGHGGDHAAHGSNDEHGDHDADKGHKMHHKTVGPLTTNLAGEHRTRFINVTYQIEGGHKKFEEMINHAEAKIKGATISYLSSLSLAEINNNPRMMQLISSELKDKLNAVHGVDGVVENLDFTEFSIQ
jgi:flagellar basal body-associated protein FliL